MSSKATSVDSISNPKAVSKEQETKVSSSNENSDQRDDELLPMQWTKVASKKHPGRFYYFNVITKESLWEHPGRTKALEKEKDIIRSFKPSKEKPSSKSEKVILLKNDAQFKRKNLAKDRLEKLQKQLEVERKQTGEKKKVERQKVGKDVKTPETPTRTSPVESLPAKSLLSPQTPETPTRTSPVKSLPAKSLLSLQTPDTRTRTSVKSSLVKSLLSPQTPETSTRTSVKSSLVKSLLSPQTPETSTRTSVKSSLVKSLLSPQTPETPTKTSPVKSSPVKSSETRSSQQKRKRTDPLESPSNKSKTAKLSPKSRAIYKKVSLKDEQKKLRIVEDVKEEVQKQSEASTKFKSFKIPKKAKQETVSSSIFVDIQKLKDAKPVDSHPPKTDATTSIPPNKSVPKKQPKTPEDAPKSPPRTSYAQKLLEAIERSQASPSPEIPTAEAPTFTSTPKVQTLIRAEVDSPSFVKSPANERLAGIREKLAQEVALLDEDAEMTDLSDALPQNQHSSTEAEAMDWEDIPEDVALREVVAVRQLPNGAISKESVLDTTIPGYGTQLIEQDHFQRFVFLVVDTNVFLSQLKGVERLLEKGFPHIGQPILIVPYIVLQELDRIKHREQGRPLSQAAAHSIRFLNDHLKRRDPRVKGQSIMEAANRLIPVENADDNIMNCCLQVRQIIAGFATDLMLLSNDVNLRNKALVNGVQAFGYGELMAEADRIRFAVDEQNTGR